MNKVRITSYRTFKNFGHKRQPVPRITTLWHGFLTFSFIGMGLEWKRIGKYFFGDDKDDNDISPGEHTMPE